MTATVRSWTQLSIARTKLRAQPPVCSIIEARREELHATHVNVVLQFPDAARTRVVIPMQVEARQTCRIPERIAGAEAYEDRMYETESGWPLWFLGSMRVRSREKRCPAHLRVFGESIMYQTAPRIMQSESAFFHFASWDLFSPCPRFEQIHGALASLPSVLVSLVCSYDRPFVHKVWIPSHVDAILAVSTALFRPLPIPTLHMCARWIAGAEIHSWQGPGEKKHWGTGTISNGLGLPTLRLTSFLCSQSMDPHGFVDHPYFGDWEDSDGLIRINLYTEPLQRETSEQFRGTFVSRSKIPQKLHGRLVCVSHKFCAKKLTFELLHADPAQEYALSARQMRLTLTETHASFGKVALHQSLHFNDWDPTWIVELQAMLRVLARFVPSGMQQLWVHDSLVGIRTTQGTFFARFD